jgi:general secretion pathway protein H
MEMEKERTRATRRAERGFTLVELLVVLVIVGLASAAVVLAMPRDGEGLAMQAERFAARAKTARDTALIEARPMAVRIDAEGYEIASHADGRWAPAARHGWGAGVVAAVHGGAEGRTVFDPTGFADPLRVTLRRGGERIDIGIGHDGRIAIDR